MQAVKDDLLSNTSSEEEESHDFDQIYKQKKVNKNSEFEHVEELLYN